MFRSKLFLRLFSMLTLVVALFSSAIYLFSVPLIKEKAYEIELDASRTILDNVFELASKIHMNLETHRTLALNWHKNQLQNIIALASSYIDYVLSMAERGEISPQQARRLVFEGLRTFKYGHNDYIWITDYNAVLLSHPDPEFQGRDVSAWRDHDGQQVLNTIITIARSQGEGFSSYGWRRLGDETDSEKISYFKDFPQWGFVVGTGVYLDDIAEEVARRKADAIRELRQALRNIRIAKTGYIYIFDSADHMIIHPNANIEEKNFASLPDPVTGRPIGQELKEATHKSVPVHYLWDKPTDPNNYIYEKISWIRYFEGFDWYIASSVYVEELRRSSEVLGNRILAIAVAVMVLATSLGYLAARRLVQPLNRLAQTAARVQAGDLSAVSGIRRDDEIGILAGAFDAMVQRLRRNIATLDSRVCERTAALEDSNQRLHAAMAAQRQTQQTLVEIEARQRLILDALPASIATLDGCRRLGFVNRRWAEQVGREKSALIGRPLAAVVGRAIMRDIHSFLDRAYAGEGRTFEYALTGEPVPSGEASLARNRRPGQNRPRVCKVTLIPEITGTPPWTMGVLVLVLDITDEKETARQLQEAQRLEVVGQLAGGLAHDFNNLLSIIMGNLAAARDSFATSPGLDAYLEPALRAGRRGADITSRLLSFARRHHLKPILVDVCALAQETAQLLRRTVASAITVSVPKTVGCCRTVVDPGQLENALVNLALNARDAMPQGGKLAIRVSAGEAPPDADALSDPAQLPPSPPGWICLRVEDSGSGFSPEALARGFEPFYTTKSLGSGLGLSMVYGFVKQSGGAIRLENRAQGGAAVVMWLPRATAPAAADDALPAADAPLPAPPTPAGSTTAAGRAADFDPAGLLVLLVEDDPDVRQVVRRLLASMGCAVLEAASGDEALSLVRGLDGIGLVLSDVVMPGQRNGFALARFLRRWHPEIPVILMSGFSLEDAPPPAELADLPLLRKPFEKQALMETLCRSLSGGSAPGSFPRAG